ncbi:N-acetyltransferase [Neorhizobium sp. P12A]|uniref:GNAT family N-acetyltransferase n=1 Tax=Neorhizobium sp. P12A TaxID=2268027 RepID=UPI0011EC42F4|nr:GNAT family N-acetyltransferase [Neorhizobium sp. P12A]KAA0698679.1 N-acetyltransferase [Neorhizobium sp. P12A]
MTVTLRVVVDTLPDDVTLLASAAEREGYEHIRRLVDEWADGLNRFSRRGERLLVAFEENDVVAIGGLTVEFSRVDWLRMRRFYVLPQYRGRGIGRMIARELLNHAKAFTDRVTVHAGDPDAALFWHAMGFQPMQCESYTHLYRFG